MQRTQSMNLLAESHRRLPGLLGQMENAQSLWCACRGKEITSPKGSSSGFQPALEAGAKIKVLPAGIVKSL